MKRYNGRFELTPDPKGNRWRKIYKGELYYVGRGHCKSKTDREGYRFAIEEWRGLRSKLDNEPTEEERHRYEAVQSARVKLEQTKETVDQELAVVLGRNWKEQAQKQSEEVTALIEKVEGKRKPDRDSIAACAAAFLQTKRDRHDMDGLSACRVQAIARDLRHIERTLGPDTLVTTINEDTVKTYFKTLVSEVKAGQVNNETAHGRWKLWVEWVTSLTQVSIPRNLHSRDFVFRRHAKSIKVPTITEITPLLADTVPERWRVCFYLMLNCGMYAGDVSNLKPEEVDWDNGTITRKRSKTAKHESTPTITYKLWPETFALLKKLGRRDGDRVFVDRKGNPLVQRIFNHKTGKLKSQDCIYDYYRKNFAKTRPGLMKLRKVGANMIHGNLEFRHLYRAFLGRQPKGIDERNYIAFDQGEFNRAMDWFGKEFMRQLQVDSKKQSKSEEPGEDIDVVSP